MRDWTWTPLGNLLTLGAALCWGLYGVCLETAGSQGLTQLQATRKVFFYGLLTMLPLFPILRPCLTLSPFWAEPMMIFHILYLGLAASALILDEPVLPQALGAIAFILLGLWLSQRR